MTRNTKSNLNSKITNLINYFNKLSWMERIFFPGELKQALQNPESSDFDIVLAAFRSTSFFQRRLFIGLSDFFEATDIDFDSLNEESPDIQVCKLLYKCNLFTYENFRAVIDQNECALLKMYKPPKIPFDYSSKLLNNQKGCVLHNKNVVYFDNNQAHLIRPWGNNVGTLRSIINRLEHEKVKIASNEELRIIRAARGYTHDDPYVSMAIIHINETGLLDGAAAQANFSAVVANKNPRAIACVFRELNEAGLLTTAEGQANFEAVLVHQNPKAIVYGLLYLNSAKLLNTPEGQGYFNRIIQYATLLGNDEHLGSDWRETSWSLLSQTQGHEHWAMMIKLFEGHKASPIEARQAWIDYIEKQKLEMLLETEPHHTDDTKKSPDIQQGTTVSPAKFLNKAGLFSEVIHKNIETPTFEKTQELQHDVTLHF